MLTLIRGIPGSGKSTYALRHYPGRLIVEADMLTMQGGRYRFDVDKLPERRQAALSIVSEALSIEADVVVTGTLATKAELDKYIDLARMYDSSHEVVVCEGKFQSVHAVPLQVIASMKDRWYQFPGETVVSF